jgi:hypothetical protein
MPAGHKAIHDEHVHIIWKSGRSVNLTTNRYIMCRQRAGLGFVVIFSKRPAGHGKGLRGPRVEDPCRKGLQNGVLGLNGKDVLERQKNVCHNHNLLYFWNFSIV